MMIAIIAMIGLMLYRAYKGPSVYDRMNAVGVIGADVIVLIVLFGYLDKRPDMYVDISMAYAFLGFIGAVVVAKFLGGKKI
jgi:multicomponent Na+:H+ antiporter subunit F